MTTFTAGAREQTLPLGIFNNLFRPNQAPVVNVVAAVLIVASIIPIWFAQRLSGSQSEGLTAPADGPEFSSAGSAVSG